MFFSHFMLFPTFLEKKSGNTKQLLYPPYECTSLRSDRRHFIVLTITVDGPGVHSLRSSTCINIIGASGPFWYAKGVAGSLSSHLLGADPRGS